MRYRIERTDRTVFTAPVREHHFEYRVAPWNDSSQRLQRLEVSVEPATELTSHRDCFGNEIHSGALLGAHDRLVVHLSTEVETLLSNPFAFEPVAPAREAEWIADSLRQAPRLWDFVLHRSPLTPELIATGPDEGKSGDSAAPPTPAWRPGVPLLTQVQEALAWIGDGFTHDPERPGAAPLAELLEARVGNCAELSHLLVAIVRSWQIPARCVTGYLDAAYFDPDDEDGEDAQPRPQTRHCWTEVLVPGGGWRGFDAAQGLLADETYIRLGIGRDAHDVIGQRQSFKGEGEITSQQTEIDVTRLD